MLVKYIRTLQPKTTATAAATTDTTATAKTGK
jgi:hypothetical protein